MENQPASSPSSSPATQNQLALWALIAAIGAVVFYLLAFVAPAVGWLALLAGIAALVLGIMGNSRAKTMGGAGRGQAIAGIVIGAIMIGLFVIGIIIIGAAIGGLS